MINSRVTSLNVCATVVHPAMLSSVLASLLYFGAVSSSQAQSGDGPVAGAIVGDLFPAGPADPVIVTTACLEGNPFVPFAPPAGLDATLSGCKLDIPAGSTLSVDNHQLITVLPNNFKDESDLSFVNTFTSGSNTGLEFDTTVRAVSKDIFLGLANPGLFDSPAVADTSSPVASTADVFCTSVSNGFACARIEPCSSPSACSSSATCGGLVVDSDDSDGFCSRLSGLLEGSYNLVTNPLAYAVSTNMTDLAQANSVTLKLCSGFRAQCLPYTTFPTKSPIVANIRVTSMHTQNAAVDTPRLRLPYY
jgi:hypothetical protein